MQSKTFGIIYGLVMVALIVAIDLTFLRHDPWLRLVVNVSIVVVFGSVYWFVIRKR